MRAFKELGGVILAGLAVFLGLIAGAAIALVLGVMALASALLLMVSAFGGLMYVFTQDQHARLIALAYLGYAAVPFLVAFVLRHYLDKRADPKPKPRQVKAAPDISGVRLTRDVDFSRNTL